MVVVCTVGAAVASAVAGAQESAVPGRAQSQGHGGPALSADTGLSLPSVLPPLLCYLYFLKNYCSCSLAN